MHNPSMLLHLSLDPVIHKKTSAAAERRQVVGEGRYKSMKSDRFVSKISADN